MKKRNKVNEDLYNSIMKEIAKVVKKKITEGYEGWTSTSDFASIPAVPVKRPNVYDRLSLVDFSDPMNNQKWTRLFPVLNLKLRGQIGTAFTLRFGKETMDVHLYRSDLAELFDAFSVFMTLFDHPDIKREYGTSIKCKYSQELKMLFERYIDLVSAKNPRYMDDVYDKVDSLMDAIESGDVDLDSIDSMVYMMMVRIEEKV